MIEIISERRPLSKKKLSKPKELKGIKQEFSYKYGSGRKMPVFICGEDIWINHKDWCSISGTELERIYFQKTHMKFIYNDCFSAGVVRPGYAWIRLNGAMDSKVKTTEIIRKIVKECLIDNSRFCIDDERMFCDCVIRCRARLNKDDSCRLRDLSEVICEEKYRKS